MTPRRTPRPVRMLVAVLALALVAGPAWATASPAARLTKAKVRHLAAKVIDKKAPALSVAHAGTADQATTATSADNATTAGTAQRADTLDGLDSTDFARRCAVGSIAAMSTWYAPQVPTGGTYVQPNRYGGEDGYVCGGGALEMTKLAVGHFRVRPVGSVLGSPGVYVAMINADSRGSTTLVGMGTSKLAGPVWDVHVVDLAGVATDPYYLDVMLVRQR